MYQTVLFDLDGTLTDPGIGITNSVAYALQKRGISVNDRSELYKFIGPPLHDSFAAYYGFSDAECESAIADYREYFRARGLYENTLYPDTVSLLRELKAAKKTLILATSKPQEFAETILKHFCLDGYFDFVAGATMDNTRNQKADVIAYALHNCPNVQLSQTVMVGDRKQDVLGAAQNGIDCVGVLYGYGDRPELTAAGATYLAQNISQLLSILIKE